MKQRARKRKSKTKPAFFDPDDIATTMSRKLTCDLTTPAQMYGGSQRSLVMFRETQIANFLKKYVSDSAQDLDRLEAATYKKFLEVNAHMANYREVKTPTVDRLQRTDSVQEKVLLRARALMLSILGRTFEYSELFQCCKHGPGTTIGVSFQDTSMEQKFRYPISVTERAKPLMEQYFLYDDRLTAAVERLNAGQYGNKYDFVRGSQATTVPKTNTIRRMIAVEPTANMYLQQGLMTLMYRRMKGFGLDVATLPSTHKKLAQYASITGNYATIDFTSASDCVSTKLLEWLLPPQWFRVYDMIRCTSMKVDGQWIELNMSSTMGNAVTFPLESLVFWTLGQALHLTLGKGGHTFFPEWEDLKHVSVFGDDCIVPDWLYDPFVDLCQSFGFMVNKEKSFHGPSPFRESCGGDYLQGRDVRPYNIRFPTSRRKSALEPWLYTIMNGVIKKYITYFGTRNYVYDKQLFRYCFDLFRKYDLKVKVVPSDYPDDSGLHISEDLQRWRTAYNIRLSTISVSDQGLYSFLFCNFRYWKRESQDEELRYYDWLRRPFYSKRVPIHVKPVRTRGGYVVARGLASNMTLNDLHPRG